MKELLKEVLLTGDKPYYVGVRIVVGFTALIALIKLLALL